jgi:HK97 family phage portal protein
MLRWAPNSYQTATEYFASQVAQFLLRDKAYAEIVSGPGGFLDQLLPRHPDRVFPQRLPSGRLTYKLIEANGQPRWVTQDEMHVVRDLSGDGISGLSRVQYGANVIGGALAAERAAGKFFKSGMAAAMVATYKGAHMEDEDEQALHRSITRYAAGTENNFGLLLIPDDVTSEPRRRAGQGADDAGPGVGRARSRAALRIPPHKLMIAGTQTYASQVQSATDYVVGCLRPTAHTFEQAIQRDLILAKDTYFVSFRLEELLRGDPQARADYYEKAIKNRWMRPSEVRIIEGMNPDRRSTRCPRRTTSPGSPAAASAERRSRRMPAERRSGSALPPQGDAGAAQRCGPVRPPRARAGREAGEEVREAERRRGVAGRPAGLLRDHSRFVAERMRLPIRIARGYAGQRGSLVEAKGVVVYDGETWEQEQADDLAVLALSDGAAMLEAA